MGHKHSTLHRQLKQQNEPNIDLMTGADSGGVGGGGGGTRRGLRFVGTGADPDTDYVLMGPQSKQARKLSMRNISIRRSFHISSKKSKSRGGRFENSKAVAATTDDINLASNCADTTVASHQATNIPSSTCVTTVNGCGDVMLNKNNVGSGGGGGCGTTVDHSRLSSDPISTSSADIFASSSLTSSPSIPLPSSSSASASISLPRGGSVRKGNDSGVASSFKTSRNGDYKNKYVMDRIRKSFRNSFRRKKDHVPESLKPHQWQADEAAVKAGNCMFSVKYLGCVEVFESRGMQICEDALRRLRNSRRRAVKGMLYVTGDGLRVVDDETKGLLVDQTIEKVSFCAPDRSHERGFSYICRDGTTRRWMCHGFHATKDSGERLSHAVGCAFSVCLERKQRRDKEAVNSVFDPKTATFTRTGSFRASSITERMQDPQVAKPAEPPPLKPVHNPYAVERPHAAASLLQRQGSLRGGPLNQASPFKRQLSLRLGIDTLPSSGSAAVAIVSPLARTNNSFATSSTATSATHRERAHSLDFTSVMENGGPSEHNILHLKKAHKSTIPGNLFSLNSKITLATPSVEPIEEVSPSFDTTHNPMLGLQQTATTTMTQSESLQENQSNIGSSSIIAAMCQELSQGLSMLATMSTDGADVKSATKTSPTTANISNSSFSSWSPGHFSPPASLNSSSVNCSASFSAFDKWISTNGGKKASPPEPTPSYTPTTKPPLIPPPVVDKMPDVTAPPPPSSPSYSTTFSPHSEISSPFKHEVTPTDYHSSLFSDLTASFKKNLAKNNSNTTTTAATTISSTSTIVENSAKVTATSTISPKTAANEASIAVAVTNIPQITDSDSISCNLRNGIDTAAVDVDDPFDAEWAELSNHRILLDRPQISGDSRSTLSPPNGEISHQASELHPSSSQPVVLFKSTNPFLDLSQYDTASPHPSTCISTISSTTDAATTKSTSTTTQQMFKAFEVHM